MDVRSYVSEFLSFSSPIEEGWLTKIKGVPKIYIIGDGVTAQEYSHIIRKLGEPFECVSSKEAIVDPLSLSGGYMIVACHQERKNVVNALGSAKFIRGEHFETFFRLLRNRAVFDFRGDFDFSEADWLEVISYIKSFPTLGGIDIVIDTNDVVRLPVAIGKSLRKLASDFHVKLSINFDGQFDIHTLRGLDVDLVELLVRGKGRKYFDPSAFDKLCKEALFRHAHVVYIECNNPVVGENFSSDRQEKHPPYYDAMLTGHDLEQMALKDSDNRFCLSRRMFPIFDEKLNLKLCSLYDSVARTNISCLDSKSRDYIVLRNTLCTECKQVGLYRKL